MKFSNGLDDAQLERLAILSEELGEAQQAVGKILRHGYDSYNPLAYDSYTSSVKGVITNRDDLTKELGDVVYALSMLIGASDISGPKLVLATTLKAEKIKPYLHHQRKDA